MKIIEDELAFESGMSFIDLGSGSGFYASKFTDKYKLQTTVVDNSKSMLDQISNSKIKKRIVDLEKLNKFEASERILAAGVLEFIDDPQIMIQTISQSLLENGVLVIMIPTDDFNGKLYSFIHKIWGCPTNLHDPIEIVKLAKKYNLELVRKRKVHIFNTCLTFKRLP